MTRQLMAWCVCLPCRRCRWGILTTMLSVVAIVLFLYGDWAARLTDAVERKVSLTGRACFMEV